jgi:hypothetical protein
MGREVFKFQTEPEEAIHGSAAVPPIVTPPYHADVV